MKEEKVIDYEVEDSKPVEGLDGNTGSCNSGGATSDKGNISAYYAIAAVLAVILFVIAILLQT